MLFENITLPEIKRVYGTYFLTALVAMKTSCETFEIYIENTNNTLFLLPYLDFMWDTSQKCFKSKAVNILSKVGYIRAFLNNLWANIK